MAGKVDKGIKTYSLICNVFILVAHLDSDTLFLCYDMVISLILEESFAAMEPASSRTLNKRPTRENMKEVAREVSFTAYKGFKTLKWSIGNSTCQILIVSHREATIEAEMKEKIEESMGNVLYLIIPQ
ncbi:hypothetical protein SOVF_072710 isoform B [Spinacia oleracea]|nr:hypothetical protein SOVF_072710 isoform B [Spinacia oleracea]